eukprot:31205-Pelagococcus_subviridis.AAC.25
MTWTNSRGVSNERRAPCTAGSAARTRRRPSTSCTRGGLVRLGRYPRRGVRRGPSALRLVVVDPLRAQRDRVFDLRVIRVRARRATSGWSSGARQTESKVLKE